jgi:hypothetical protein
MRPIPHKRLMLVLLIFLIIVAVAFLTPDNDNDAIAPHLNGSTKQKSISHTVDKYETENKQSTLSQKQKELNQKSGIPEGVNTVFHDKPETQVIWMERGKALVVKNKPDADAADFRNTFFHRGAKARPVTCGEVQFRTNDSITESFQRFIYTGIESTYLEHDVVNFDIFWSIMCEQTLDDYFDDESKL